MSLVFSIDVGCYNYASMLFVQSFNGGVVLCFLKLSPKGHVSMKELEKKWKHLCLPVEQLRALLQLDSFGDEVEWMKILALGCSALGGVC